MSRRRKPVDGRKATQNLTGLYGAPKVLPCLRELSSCAQGLAEHVTRWETFLPRPSVIDEADSKAVRIRELIAEVRAGGRNDS